MKIGAHRERVSTHGGCYCCGGSYPPLPPFGHPLPRWSEGESRLGHSQEPCAREKSSPSPLRGEGGGEGGPADADPVAICSRIVGDTVPSSSD